MRLFHFFFVTASLATLGTAPAAPQKTKATRTPSQSYGSGKTSATAKGAVSKGAPPPPPQIVNCQFKMENLRWYPGKTEAEKAVQALLSFESTTVVKVEGNPDSCLKEGAVKVQGLPEIVVTKDTPPADINRSAAETHITRLFSVDNIELKGEMITVFFHCGPPSSATGGKKTGGGSSQNLRLIFKNPGILSSGSYALNLAKIIGNNKFTFDKIEGFGDTEEQLAKMFEATTKTPVIQLVGHEQPNGTPVLAKVEMKVPAPCSEGGKTAALKGYNVGSGTMAAQTVKGKGKAAKGKGRKK